MKREPEKLKAAFRAEPVRPLASILEPLSADPVALRVFAQDNVAPPHPGTLVSPLSSEAVLLRRITGYSVGPIELSRHAAFVDLAAIDAELAARLRDGRTNLGQVFADPRIQKSMLACGDQTTADDEIVRLLAARDPRMLRYLWRRYTAGFDSRVAFLVIELLDLSSIEAAVLSGARTHDVKR